LYAPASRWARALELGVLSPANLALIGGRATPPDGPARRVLDGLGATTFSLEDVLHDGMATVAQEALETAASGTEAVYLSVDLGVIAGLGDPVGLQARELAAGVAVVASTLLAAADVCGPSSPSGSSSGGDAAAAGARIAAEIVTGAARRLS
jgi:arginase family enzyme